jgi:hypothetical protein
MNNNRPFLGTPRHIGTIPDCLNRPLPWRRILIRTGFNAIECGDHFDFSSETEDNRRYFNCLLQVSNVGGRFGGDLFYPLTPEINELTWLQTIEHNHGGAESGRKGFNNIELLIMDTFLAGLTRWLSYIGIENGCSCDGHGTKIPNWGPSDEADVIIFIQCLKQVSTDNILFMRPGRLCLPGPPSRTIENIRPLLLDLAENIYAKRDDLADFVKVSRA